MNRLTSAQQKGQRMRASGRSYRGGKTRSQQTREKVADAQEKRRENNTTLAQVSQRACREQWRDETYFGVYGIVRDGYEWVVTMMAAADQYEKLDGSLKVRGRYAMRNDRPADGLELARFDQKHEAMSYAGADSSTKIQAGEYVVRTEDDPKTRRVTLDQEEFAEFRRNAMKA